MDILTTIIVLVPTTLSLCISGIYAYIALKKANEPPKDEIWETTTKILCNNKSSSISADVFANLYEELKLFKDNGCSLKGLNTLAYANGVKHKQERIQSAKN